MAYETDALALLQYMHDKKIAIEINLFSNEFILKVKDDKHPITLYKNGNVPIVISTDDAGILRSNLIHQYVLLAKRYPQISYADIRTFILNSIEYSFIKDQALKNSLYTTVKTKLESFEEKIIKNTRPHSTKV
jgi:adenosine deaminase